jgi:hypothetical protein
MSKFLDGLGTTLQNWQIGLKQAGARTIRFTNSNGTGTLTWNPTTNRTLTLPDTTDTLAVTADCQFPLVTVTSSKTLGLSDIRTFQYCTNTATCDLTVPANATVAFPIGTILDICQTTAFAVTVTGASGVTVSRNGSSTNTHALLGQNAVAALKKISTDGWIFFHKSSTSPNYTFLLDAVPNPAMAVSTFQLSSSATNSMTVRRSSDSTTTNVGFSGGSTNGSTITTFGGAGNTFLTSYIDQSGNSRNLVSTNATYQPKTSVGATLNVWTSGSSVVVPNGIAGTRYDCTYTLPSAYTVFAVMKGAGASGTSAESPYYVSSDGKQAYSRFLYGSANLTLSCNTFGDANDSTNYCPSTTDNLSLVTARFSSTKSYAISAILQIGNFNKATFTTAATGFSTLNYPGQNYTNCELQNLAGYLVYPRLISMNEQQILEGFFANRLGFNSSLPAFHPYTASFPW